MPPLYRIPIAYLLLAATVGAGFLLRAVAERTLATASPEPAAASTIGPKSPAVSAPPSPPEPDPALPAPDGVLRTPEGLRRKVLVKDLDLVPRTEPIGGLPASKRLDYFDIRFVYDERAENGSRMLRVGPQGGPPDGWVIVSRGSTTA